MGGLILVMNKIAFSVESLCVDYIELSHGLFNPLGKSTPIRALDNICLTIEEGQIVALIGRNGAGKSTLLRAVSGLLRPSGGRIETFGRVVLLAGTDPGFFLDETGRRNIHDLALAYGVNEDEIDQFCESIVEFTGLGDDIDRNVRGYSSGMKGKLGFGFITGLKPDILLIDETLGVGDAEFRKKAQKRLIDFMKVSKTVIISTHSFGLAKQLCNSGIVLESGELRYFGEINKSMEVYRGLLNLSEEDGGV